MSFDILTALKSDNEHIPLIQGPLAGVSNAVFRSLVWDYSDILLVCSEMISVKTILNGSELIKKRYLSRAENERALCYQISGDDPIDMAKAVTLLTNMGADAIDLNCGCPVKKIRKKGLGSALLARPDHLGKLIAAMKDHTDVPISLKLRVDADSGDNYNDALIDMINHYKPDYISVHGRHYTNRYEKPSSFDEIKYFVDRVDCPVVGNGDVKCAESLKKLMVTGCDGVMVCRAGVGQPWLFNTLLDPSYQAPSIQERGEIFIRHIRGLCDLFVGERFGVYQARSLAKYYARDIKGARDFVNEMQTIDKLESFTKLCRQFFNKT